MKMIIKSNIFIIIYIYSWFSPKCVGVQKLTRHLGVKHYFGAGRESGTKSWQTLNIRYDLKITGVKVGQ